MDCFSIIVKVSSKKSCQKGFIEAYIFITINDMILNKALNKTNKLAYTRKTQEYFDSDLCYLFPFTWSYLIPKIWKVKVKV